MQIVVKMDQTLPFQQNQKLPDILIEINEPFGRKLFNCSINLDT